MFEENLSNSNEKKITEQGKTKLQILLYDHCKVLLTILMNGDQRPKKKIAWKNHKTIIELSLLDKKYEEIEVIVECIEYLESEINGIENIESLNIYSQN